jgi:4-hydroxy-2-oxoheptanedioate aldolase
MWMKLPCMETIEIAALAAFDFVALDMEHAPLSLETASAQVGIARSHGLMPFVRISRIAAAEISRMVDAGAAGIIFPHVTTAADALLAARQLRFEPNGGTRGVGNTSRAGGWGLEPLSAYLDDARRPLAVAMIEDREAVENIGEMASAGVDALLVGPSDLSVACGCEGDPKAPEVEALINRVVAAGTSAGVPCGIALGGPERVSEFRTRGFTFFVVGNDATTLARAAAAVARQARL